MYLPIFPWRAVHFWYICFVLPAELLLQETDVAGTVQLMFHSLLEEGQKAIPFIDGHLGRRFLSLFSKPYSGKIKFGRDCKKDEARWKVTSA